MRFVKMFLALCAGLMGANASHAVTFVAAADGDIVAYFAGTTAAYTETLGLEINGVATGVTGLNNQASTVGDTLVLGTAQKGDVLTFFIDVTNTGYRFFSDISRNPDGVEHIRYDTGYTGNGSTLPAGTFIGFEDLYNGGDFNYNDLTFVFTNVAENEAPVPEAATWAMMVVGFGLTGMAMRRRTVVFA